MPSALGKLSTLGKLILFTKQNTTTFSVCTQPSHYLQACCQVHHMGTCLFDGFEEVKHCQRGAPACFPFVV